MSSWPSILSNDALGKPVVSAIRGNLLASSTDKEIRLWSSESGKHIENLVAHTSPVTMMAFHPYHNILLSAQEGGDLYIWWHSVYGRLNYKVIPMGAEITALSFSSTGRVLVGTDTGEVIIGRLSDDSTALHPEVLELELLDATIEIKIPEVKIHDVAWEIVKRFPHRRSKAVRYLGTDKSGQLLLVSTDRSAAVWAIKDLTAIRQIASVETDSDIVAAAISPTGSAVALGLGDGEVLVHDTFGNKQLYCVDDDTAKISGVAVAEDGQHLMVVRAFPKKKDVLWGVQSTPLHEDHVQSIYHAVDGKAQRTFQFAAQNHELWTPALGDRGGLL